MLGWCSKKLSQNPRGSMGWCSKSWGGAAKSCPRIPTARWGGVPKVGVVIQKVVPESPLCILLIVNGQKDVLSFTLSSLHLLQFVTGY